MDEEEKDMLKHAYLPLNNDVQSLIVKTFIFVHDDRCNDQQQFNDLVEAFQSCANPSYKNLLMEHIHNEDYDSIIVNLICICRNYIRKHNHFIIIDSDQYKVPSMEQTRNLIRYMTTVDSTQTQKLENIETELTTTVAEIINPFNFDFF